MFNLNPPPLFVLSLRRRYTAVACPPALTTLSDKYPGLQIYCAMIDEILNDKVKGGCKLDPNT